MPRLTIVIPALGDVESFETTILSVLESRPADCEILVPQCGDYADPYSLSDEVSFIEQPAAASGVDLFNVGLQAARGEFVHLLGAGATVTPGWADAALGLFSDRLLGSVSPVLLEPDQSRITGLGLAFSASGTAKLVANGKSFTEGRLPKAKIAGPSLFAGFYRRLALDEVGGWPTTVGDDLADLDLALSLTALGWTSTVATDSKVLLASSLRVTERSFRQAWFAERVFWRHAATAGWLKSLVMHPFAIAMESATSLPAATALTQPLARMLACVEIPSHLRFQRELQAAAFGLAGATGSHEEEHPDVLPLKRPTANDKDDRRPVRRVS